jgi:hypothetical protein
MISRSSFDTLRTSGTRFQPRYINMELRTSGTPYLTARGELVEPRATKRPAGIR